MVWDRVEVLAYIDIQHPVLSLPRDDAVQFAQRLVRRAPRSEAIRARQEVLLVNGLQNHGDRPLCHLVLEGRDAERPSRAVRLGDVASAHRRCLIATGLDAFEKVHKVGLQVRLVALRRHTVDAGRAILAGQLVGFLHPFQVDDVVQREQRCSPLLPRQFGYPLSFRGQVRGVHAPSRVSRQWFSPRDASLPSSGSRRAQFPALSGTMKALRLPTRVSTVTYLFRSRNPPDPSSFVCPRSAPGRSEVPPGPGPLLVPAAPSPACSHVDANGISQVSRRSFLCLCSVPGPRSNQRILATIGPVGAAPAGWTAKASAMSDFGANTQLRHPLPYASRGRCRTRARLASGWQAVPLPGGNLTHWIASRGFSSYRRSFPSPVLLTQPPYEAIHPCPKCRCPSSRPCSRPRSWTRSPPCARPSFRLSGRTPWTITTAT